VLFGVELLQALKVKAITPASKAIMIDFFIFRSIIDQKVFVGIEDIIGFRNYYFTGIDSY